MIFTELPQQHKGKREERGEKTKKNQQNQSCMNWFCQFFKNIISLSLSEEIYVAQQIHGDLYQLGDLQCMCAMYVTRNDETIKY